MLNHVISIIIISFAPNKNWEPKENFWKEERKGIKTLIVVILFPFSFGILKGFQLAPPWWGLDASLNKLSKYINFIKFGVGMIPQLIILPNVLLIGIFMPLIKIQTKYFNKPEQRVCWACISHKFHNHIKFITFWNDIVFQILFLSNIT